MLSLIPSLKYSELGSLLALTKGSTASESIASLRVRKTVNHVPNASSAAKTSEPAPRIAFLRHHGLAPAAGTTPLSAATRAESVSRFRRCKSARRSEALW